MKQVLMFILLALVLSPAANGQENPQYEVKIITTIESIIPSGVGRSRLLSTDHEVDYKEFTTRQTAEKGDRNKSDREEIRIKDYDETKLLNVFNVGGIRFQNIASNDALLTSKINDMMSQGWELAFVNTGVESYGGADDTNGIFITRYIFKRQKVEGASTTTDSIPE